MVQTKFNYMVKFGIDMMLHLLIIAFLISTIVYIHKINKFYVEDANSKVKSVKYIDKTLQDFLNIMAWILLITILINIVLKIF